MKRWADLAEIFPKSRISSLGTGGRPFKSHRLHAKVLWVGLTFTDRSPKQNWLTRLAGLVHGPPGDPSLRVRAPGSSISKLVWVNKRVKGQAMHVGPRICFWALLNWACKIETDGPTRTARDAHVPRIADKWALKIPGKIQEYYTRLDGSTVTKF